MRRMLNSYGILTSKQQGGSDIATVADIATHVKRLQPEDRVILKVQHHSHFRAIEGTLHRTGTIPTMLTSTGQLLVIRPIIVLEGTIYEYCSIAKDTKTGR